MKGILRRAAIASMRLSALNGGKPYRRWSRLPSQMRPARRPFVLSLVLVAAILFLSTAAPSAAGPEPPSTLATAYNTERKLARDANGTLYAAVTVNVSGVPQVRVLETADGIAWTALPPPSTTGNASDRASLGIDSRGRLHVVWTENAGYDRQVFYARYEGGRWTAAKQLSHSAGYAGFPSLAVDAQDRVHVVWYGFDGAFYQIYYRRLEPTGWTYERALTNEAVDATSPAIALGPEGFVHVAWFRQNRNATYTEIAYLRLEGDLVAETPHSISPLGVTAVDPTIVATPSGIVHVIWSAFVNGTERLQHVQRDATWSAVETISPLNLAALHASLALDAASRLYVVWESLDGQIYVQTRDGAWSAPLVLSSGGTNLYPTARWSQDHNPLCGSNAQIDVVWTHESGGVRSLGYRPLTAPFPCLGAPLQEGPLALVALAVLAVGVMGFVGAFVLLRRKWYPKPPRGSS